MLSRIAPSSCGVRPSGTISESAPTCVAGSQRPATVQPSAASAQSTTCWSRLTSCSRAASTPPLGDPVDARDQPGDPHDVGRPAFEQVGKLLRHRLARRVATRAPPRARGRGLARGPT